MLHADLHASVGESVTLTGTTLLRSICHSSSGQSLRFKAVDLEKCQQVKQKLLGPVAVIEVKSQSEISVQGLALLCR
jgi:hypothetical protein